MAAEPEQFHASLAALDQELQAQIRDLKRRRKRVAALGSGDRLFLPEAVVALLDDLRRIGASEYAIQVERDSWILLSAQFPDEADGVEPILTVDATLSLITAHAGRPLPAVKRLFELCLERTSKSHTSSAPHVSGRETTS